MIALGIAEHRKPGHIKKEFESHLGKPEVRRDFYFYVVDKIAVSKYKEQSKIAVVRRKILFIVDIFLFNSLSAL